MNNRIILKIVFTVILSFSMAITIDIFTLHLTRGHIIAAQNKKKQKKSPKKKKPGPKPSDPKKCDNFDTYLSTGYDQKHRPQFHFTSRRNWHNDPNGMVYYKGEYHLFFQHNPLDRKWGNMTWGHAVSKDMIHWTQMTHAILPDKQGTIFSGSAAVDELNSAGFQKGPEKTLIAAFTYAGKFGDPPTTFNQAIAYSTDKGRTWIKYGNNPVITNQGETPNERDPKIFWHNPSGKWILVLYVKRGVFRFFSSSDLKNWTMTSDYEQEGFHECPDMVELKVDNNKDKKKWILYDAGFKYVIGTFDGKKFIKEAGPFKGDVGKNFYAAQTFNNSADNRCVQIGWMRGSGFPDMPFNQQMSIPCVLSLWTTEEGIRIFRWPVKEIEKLYVREKKFSEVEVKPGKNILKDVKEELLDLSIEFDTGSANTIIFNLRGIEFKYDVQTEKVSGNKINFILKNRNSVAQLRILIDRGSLELFGNEGEVSCTSYVLPEPGNNDLSITVDKGKMTIKNLVVHGLKSSWQ